MTYYYEFHPSFGERLARTFGHLLLTVMGLILLLAAPLVQDNILDKDASLLQNSLKIFCSSQDLWYSPELPEDFADIQLEAFSRVHRQTYNVKLVSKYHEYDGEIRLGMVKSNVKPTHSGEFLPLPKILAIVGIVCIVLNLSWFCLNHLLRLNRGFFTLFEDFWFWLRSYLNI